MRKKAFTLVEVMIVVLIIAILLAIAVPQWMNAREKSHLRMCQKNQYTLDGAKAQWALETNQPSGTPATMPDLVPYLKKVPVCPSGGVYNLGTVNTSTACSLAQHPPGG